MNFNTVTVKQIVKGGE